MKKVFKSMVIILALGMIQVSNLYSQEESKGGSFTAGADIYSTYIWRGTKFDGPSFQPTVKYVNGNFTAGVWGAYGLASGYAETDPYMSYTLPFGLTIGATDYYYEGDFSDVSDTSGSHAFEANLAYTIKSFTLSGNYILNEAGGAASVGGDTYVQASYAFEKVTLFVGAGNGWHTSDTEFAVCNVGLTATKSIEVTDKFTIPVTGQIIVNPDKKQIFMAVGLSF